MEIVLGNLFIRTMFFRKAGEVVQGHQHNFDHVTLVLTGGVSIRYDDGKPKTASQVLACEKRFWAPDAREEGHAAYALILADVRHEITALEDGTHCWCVYSHRDPQTGEVVDKFNGWMEAYWHKPAAPFVIG